MMAVEFKIAITAGAFVLLALFIRAVALPTHRAERDAADETIAAWCAAFIFGGAFTIFGSLLTALWRLA